MGTVRILDNKTFHSQSFEKVSEVRWFIKENLIELYFENTIGSRVLSVEQPIDIIFQDIAKQDIHMIY